MDRLFYGGSGGALYGALTRVLDRAHAAMSQADMNFMKMTVTRADDLVMAYVMLDVGFCARTWDHGCPPGYLDLFAVPFVKVVIVDMWLAHMACDGDPLGISLYFGPATHRDALMRLKMIMRAGDVSEVQLNDVALDSGCFDADEITRFLQRSIEAVGWLRSVSDYARNAFATMWAATWRHCPHDTEPRLLPGNIVVLDVHAAECCDGDDLLAYCRGEDGWLEGVVAAVGRVICSEQTPVIDDRPSVFVRYGANDACHVVMHLDEYRRWHVRSNVFDLDGRRTVGEWLCRVTGCKYTDDCPVGYASFGRMSDAAWRALLQMR